MKLKNPKFQAAMDAELKPLYERQDDRWERYMNCQDDTIVGGISWQVTSDSINQIKRKWHLFDIQEENGGFLLQDSNLTCLFDLDGNYITDRSVWTKFGSAFVYQRDGQPVFVSAAKRPATFAKKGYLLKNRKREFKMVFTGRFTQKGNPVYTNIELLNEQWEDWTGDYSLGNDWVNWCYENSVSAN